MQRGWNRYRIVVLNVAVTIVCLQMQALADTTGAAPLLIFRIINEAHVDQEVVEEAAKYVQSIFKESRIRTEWQIVNKTQPAARDPRGVALTIMLMTDSFAKTQDLNDGATGFALSNDGRGCRRAYIYADRAAEKAAFFSKQKDVRLKVVRALVLGHVIAHEAGHLMLPHDSHSDRGIMQPQFDVRSIDLALSGRLLFTKSQSKLMRAALTNQTRLKEF